MRRGLRGATSLIFALPLLAAWHGGSPSTVAAVLLMLTSATTLGRPSTGLLLFAGLYPVTPALSLLLSQPAFAEQLTLSFVSAAFLNAAVSRTSDRPDLARSALLLAAIVAASAVVTLAGAQLWWGEPRAFAAALWRHLTQSYFVDDDFRPLHDAVNWLEALAVAVAAERIIRSTNEPGRAVGRMFVLAGATLSASSALRLLEISLRQPAPLDAALAFLGRVRLNTFFQDINAAGSLYAMFFVAAAWLTWRRSRLWIVGTLLAGLAVWLAGSRAAFGGAVGALGVLWFASVRPRRRSVVMAAAAATALLLVIATWTPRNASVARASSFRLEITRAGLALAAEQPLVGLGLNSFKEASRRTLPADIGTRFRFASRGENAHNNFLQILVELGAIGLFAFVWMVVPPLRRVMSNVTTAPPEAAALAGGLIAFLLSALLGHPLLDDTIRLTFFLGVGLTAGLAPAAAQVSSWSPRGLGFMLVLLAVTLPHRVEARQRAEPLSGVVRGASGVQPALEDRPYRVADARSTWFITGTAQTVNLPVRAQAGSVTGCLVDVLLDGVPGNRMALDAQRWQDSQLHLPPLSRPQNWRRIDLVVTTGRCTLLVGPLEVR